MISEIGKIRGQFFQRRGSLTSKITWRTSKEKKAKESLLEWQITLSYFWTCVMDELG